MSANIAILTLTAVQFLQERVNKNNYFVHFLFAHLCFSYVVCGLALNRSFNATAISCTLSHNCLRSILFSFTGILMITKKPRSAISCISLLLLSRHPTITPIFLDDPLWAPSGVQDATITFNFFHNNPN